MAVTYGTEAQTTRRSAGITWHDRQIPKLSTKEAPGGPRSGMAPGPGPDSGGHQGSGYPVASVARSETSSPTRRDTRSLPLPSCGRPAPRVCH